MGGGQSREGGAGETFFSMRCLQPGFISVAGSGREGRGGSGGRQSCHVEYGTRVNYFNVSVCHTNPQYDVSHMLQGLTNEDVFLNRFRCLFSLA